ncbi:MAG: ComF family protein [Selenomonadales bacterium]|nr:ComF family protein [Selenomonadales bacterium]
MKRWLESLCGLIWPPKCPSCGSETEMRGMWCEQCLAEVWALRQLSVPQRGPLTMCTALVHYHGGVKVVLRDMKFRGKKKDALCLTSLLERMPASRLAGDCDVVVPVPISEHKRRVRGFNQTEVLFESWARENGLDWRADALVRVRDTEAQWRLGKRERKANLVDAFAVADADAVRGKCVLLVDDIYTTGATMEVCASLLLKAGALSVKGLVMASESIKKETSPKENSSEDKQG